MPLSHQLRQYYTSYATFHQLCNYHTKYSTITPVTPLLEQFHHQYTSYATITPVTLLHTNYATGTPVTPLLHQLGHYYTSYVICTQVMSLFPLLGHYDTSQATSHQLRHFTPVTPLHTSYATLHQFRHYYTSYATIAQLYTISSTVFAQGSFQSFPANSINRHSRLSLGGNSSSLTALFLRQGLKGKEGLKVVVQSLLRPIICSGKDSMYKTQIILRKRLKV